jgi:uncharacterized protein (TIGR02217 family)
MTGFHDVRFPLDISLKSRGGPQRRTDVVLLGSGREERNARWAHSRRKYDAGYGVKSLAALAAVVAFFEERRGMLYGFRWRDRADDRSCSPDRAPAAGDQRIGVGDGMRARFQLFKTYGASFAPYERPITKPVEGSVRIAVDGHELRVGADVALDPISGIVTFRDDRIPSPGAVVTAGYLFDVPVRFDTDYLEIDHAAFDAGEIPQIPVVEIIV